MGTKPFHFVNGNVHNNPFNPFAKKLGLLGVRAKQDHRKRIMGKGGRLHTVGFVDGKKHKFLRDIFISLIDLVSSSFLVKKCAKIAKDSFFQINSKKFFFAKFEIKYSQSCVQRPPSGPKMCGRCRQIVVVQR
jgi:hypothetical protein